MPTRDITQPIITAYTDCRQCVHNNLMPVRKVKRRNQQQKHYPQLHFLQYQQLNALLLCLIKKASTVQLSWSNFSAKNVHNMLFSRDGYEMLQMICLQYNNQCQHMYIHVYQWYGMYTACRNVDIE